MEAAGELRRRRRAGPGTATGANGRWVALLLAAGLASMAAGAEAGVIRGVLRVPPARAAEPAPNAYPGRANALPQARAIVRGQVGDAVVSIARVSTAAESAMAQQPRPAARLAQKDQAFAPRVLAVAVGSTVEFPNLDPIFHNVFSVSPVKRFDLGKYPRGQSRSQIFRRAGLVQVFCDIHADMAGYILVLPNHAFARPDTDGAFALPSLPPGAYTLRVWHPDLPELERRVVVPAEGDVALDLTY